MKKIIILIIISIVLGVFITWITSLTYSKTDECQWVWYGFPVWVKYEEPTLPVTTDSPQGETVILGCATDFAVKNPQRVGWILDTLFWGAIVFVILLIVTKLILKKRSESQIK